MKGPGRLAVVAAMPEELAALTARLGSRSPGRSAGLRFHTGTLGGRALVVAATGEGARRAEEGLAALLAAVEVEEVLVLGVAGGLSPGLAVGALVAGAWVRHEAGGAALTPARPALPGVADGTVLTVERIASTCADKSRLWEGIGSPAPAVVDLESAVYARAASAADLPWRVVRAVSDRAEEDLPLDLETFRDPDGAVSRARVARHAATRPALLRRLLALKAVVESCSVRLAESVERELAR
jgi:adenosylhomocysteine nucleosidase